MQENKRAIRFALIICIISSGLLSFAAQYLKPYQEENIRIDKMKNIIKALDVRESGQEETEDYFGSIQATTISKLYTENITGVVVDAKGTIIDGILPTDLKEDETERRALYLHKVGSDIKAYCLPISGKGLWSTIKGYLALEKNLNIVKGLTFYSHGETPGLGGEIDKNWFTNNYKGKEVLDADGSIASITIVKGKALEKSKTFSHEVDGIAGATLTAKGVNEFMKKDLDFFAPYIAQNKTESEGASHE
ncbi:MAG: NADH:ubiquinone reductase (Na(+)-transporting) subunit C [Fibrobacterales bacterium]